MRRSMLARLRWLPCVAIVLLVGMPQLAQGMTTTISSTVRGWYNDEGQSNGAFLRANIAVGDNGFQELRNWFTFDLSGIDAPVVSATLLVTNPPDGYQSSAATETYGVFDVSLGNVAGLGSDSLDIWNDLGSGTLYGEGVASETGVPTTVEIVFNADGVAAVNAARGGDLAVGGAITSLDGLPPERLFLLSAGIAASRLEITIIPEPSTALLVGAGMLALARFRRPNRPTRPGT